MSGLEQDNDTMDKTVLLSYFVISKKRYKVVFHRGILTWETTDTPYISNILSARNILGVYYNHNYNRNVCCGSHDESSGGVNNDVNGTDKSTHEPVAVSTSLPGNMRQGHNSFTIHFVQRGTSNPNKLRHEVIVFNQADSRQVASWVKTLQNYLRGMKERPRRMLLFVNPFGGKRKGLKIYEDQVKPLFEIAGINTTAIITERRDHARDILMERDLSEFDGVSCIGGDGTFAEVFNGLLMRSARDNEVDINDVEARIPVPMLKLGVIPGGSTDTMAYCFHGTIQVQTAILHIILGDSTGLDLCSVHNNGKLMRFFSSVISYGFLGDVCVDSEKLRWMGPKRYDYSGFKTFLMNKGYEGEVTVLADPSSATSGPRCVENCQRCKSSDPHITDDEQQPEISDTLPEAKTIKGKFFMISGANVSCACIQSPNGLSPYCHLGDGCVDVLLIKHTNHFNNLRLLLTLNSSDRQKSVFGLPFVEIYRAREFTFRPLGSAPNATHRTSHRVSAWNCDGEPQDETEVKIRVHRQQIRVYTRRMPDPKDDQQCCSICPKFLTK